LIGKSCGERTQNAVPRNKIEDQTGEEIFPTSADVEVVTVLFKNVFSVVEGKRAEGSEIEFEYACKNLCVCLCMPAAQEPDLIAEMRCRSFGTFQKCTRSIRVEVPLTFDRQKPLICIGVCGGPAPQLLLPMLAVKSNVTFNGSSNGWRGLDFSFPS
jgi:hypothetical protein